MTDKKYQQDPEALKRDDGYRPRQLPPCPKTTWCTLDDGHPGACHEVNRPVKP